MSGSELSESDHDWTDRLLRLARASSGLGDLALFAPLHMVSGNIIAILEIIQRVSRNKDDLKILAESIVAIIVIVRDRVLAHGESVLPRCSTLCNDLNQYLDTIVVDIRQYERNHGTGFSQYVRSTHIRDVIDMHTRRVQELRANFMIAAAIDSQFQLSSVHDQVAALYSTALELRREVVALRTDIRNLLTLRSTYTAEDDEFNDEAVGMTSRRVE
jgi:hypothetical protein